MSKNEVWIATKKGEQVLKEANRIYPEVKKLVMGDGFLLSLAIASGSFEERKSKAVSQ